MQKEITFLKTIADQNRLAILYLLQDKELCVCELTQVIPLTQGALSIQLKNLSNIGLLKSRKQSKWVFYTLATNIDFFHKSTLMALFSEIENDAFIQKLQNTQIKEQVCKN